MRILKVLLYVGVFVAAIVIAFLVRTLWYYPGIFRVEQSPLRSLTFYRPPEVTASTPPSISSLSGMEETASIPGGEGRLVLIDGVHGNGFDEAELSDFQGRLAGSGARIALVEDSDELIARLQEATGLLVIAPDDTFEPEEVQAIQEFIAKGGRLVIVGDPTRQGSVDGINSLAGAFGVIYQDAYIYNLSESDGGFRNVSFTNFGEENPITEGVSQVVFQTAYALRADQEAGIILGDENTFVSGQEVPGDAVAAALVADDRVLALPDFTFFSAPYNTFADNDLLLNNVAAFLLTGTRGFDLSDFPFFFDSATQIVYEDPVTLNATFEDSVSLRERLAEIGTAASLSEEIDQEQPFIYIAAYDDANDEILSLLEDDGVVISDDPLSDDEDAPDSEGTIAIEGVARLEKGDTVLVHLILPDADQPSAEATREAGDANAGGPVYQLVILGADEDLIANGIETLLNGELEPCMVTQQTAVCREGEFDSTAGGGDQQQDNDNEGQGGGGGGNILVVADDQGLLGPIGTTSAEYINSALSDLGYGSSLWYISSDGAPTASDLSDYDMVFWSTGDYCCSSPSEDAVAEIADYLDGGGRLFVDGMFVATDWEGTDFLNNYLGAEFDTFGVQVDMDVAEPNHPLAEGFSDTIAFFQSDELETLQPDVIQPVGDAETVFVRGPDSDAAGEPCLVALDAGTYRTAFASFPLFLLEEKDLSQLVQNAVVWLSE